MKLSAAQIHEFHENGVLIVKDVLTDADLNPIISEIEDFVDRRARELKAEGLIQDLGEGQPFEQRIATIFGQNESIMKGLDIMQMRGHRMFEFLRNKILMEVVGCLIGNEITCSPIQHLRAKVPGNIGKGNFELVPWHQDSAVTWEEADSADIVTCWIPLVDATRERGCMEVIPGQSKLGYIDHIAEGGTQIRPDLMPNILPVTAECPRGGVVFMTKLTPHRGLPNLSNCVRWTIDLRYQRTGTPTGRPFYPDFPVYSKTNPASVLTDHAKWCKMWDEGIENSKNKRWHRTHAATKA
jgi:phytanoyl-CoA hydroxylase